MKMTDESDGRKRRTRAWDSIASSLLNPPHDLRHKPARHEADGACDERVAESGDDDGLSVEHSAVAGLGHVARVHRAAVEEFGFFHPCGGDEARLRRAGAERGDADAR